MKNIKSIIIFLVVLVAIFSLPTACESGFISSSEESHILEETKRVDEILRERDRQREEIDRQNDSITKANLIEYNRSLRDSIQIIKSYTSNPNSAGGVDLNIVWKNKSKRVIKYAQFEVSAINAVDDEVYSEIGSGGRPRVTGPINPGATHGYGYSWECIWYNSTIKKCIVRSVDLEFMDGTKLSIKL